MADPAPYRVTQKLQALLQAARPDVHWFISRSAAEPLQAEEFPGCVMRIVDLKLNTIAHGGDNRPHDFWDATLHFDFHSGSGTLNTIDLENQRTMASVIAILHANPTLDGYVMDTRYKAASGSEDHSYDTGCTVFEANTIIATTVGKFDELINASGVPIP